jgi:hypothetical protein
VQHEKKSNFCVQWRHPLTIDDARQASSILSRHSLREWG